jgi:chemotaxis-related protein WspB
MLLLTFKAGPNRYAIDAARVVELVPRVELSSIPHAPPFLAGLLGYRRQVVPVVDLGSLFCSMPCRDCLSTRIILVNDAPGHHNGTQDASERPGADHALGQSNPSQDPRLLGLIGEQVTDLTEVESEKVLVASALLPQAPFLGAIVQTENGILQLINAERIREISSRDFILDQGMPWDANSLKWEAPQSELEDLKSES